MRLLIIEDDRALGRGIQLALRGLPSDLAPTLAAARTALARTEYSLLLLDVNLPDGNGLHFLRSLRRTSSVPVILLTANDLETDIVAGLDSGADDYITKPFSLAVLRARVDARIRDRKSVV